MSDDFISDTDLDAMLSDEVQRIAYQIRGTHPRAWALMLAVLCAPKLGEERDTLLVVPVITDRAHRFEMMERIGRNVRRDGYQPRVLFFSSEVWVSETSNRVYLESGEYLPPREQADRKEALVIAALTADGREKAAWCEMERDRKDRIAKVTRRMEDEDTKVEMYLPRAFWKGYVGASREVMANG